MTFHFAAIDGSTAGYIMIGIVVLRLVVVRVVEASIIPFFDAAAAILLGAISLGFTNPAGLPVVGLAFAAVGSVREFQAGRRIVSFSLLSVGAIICAYATFLALGYAHRS